MVRKALLVGIQYKGRSFNGFDPGSAELLESHRDVYRMQQLIMLKFGYPANGITLLMDDGVHIRPTRANMIEQIKKLVKNAKSDDRLFFHFSGHGVQVDDQNNDEDDGKDEAIWPVDFVEGKEETYIIDDELHDIMVHDLPPGCRLTAVFDSCHSGTIMDLPNEHKGTPRSTPRSTPQQPTVALPPDEIDDSPTPTVTTRPIDIPAPRPVRPGTANGHLQATPPRSLSASTPPMGSTPPRTIFRVLSAHFRPVAPPTISRTEASYGLLGLPYNVQVGLGKRARGAAARATPNAADPPSVLLMEPGKKEEKSPGAIVTSWAACADDQNAYEGISGAGAMVQCFIEALNEPVQHTYATLLQALSDKLDDFCTEMDKELPHDQQIIQVPQLGSLHKLDLDDKFTL